MAWPNVPLAFVKGQKRRTPSRCGDEGMPLRLSLSTRTFLAGRKSVPGAWIRFGGSIRRLRFLVDGCWEEEAPGKGRGVAGKAPGGRGVGRAEEDPEALLGPGLNGDENAPGGRGVDLLEPEADLSASTRSAGVSRG